MRTPRIIFMDVGFAYMRAARHKLAGDARLSDVLRLPKSDWAGLRAEAQAAVEAITSVHRISHLPSIDVLFTASDRYGGYTPATEERDRSLELSVIALTPRLTVVHEFGHFVDDAIGGFEVYSSQELNSLVSRVIADAERTQAIRALRVYEQQTKGTFSAERAQVIYRLQEVEIWARAYAQYIAIRSGDTQLLVEVQKRRDIDIGVLQNEQWEWNDFDLIASAIDALMQILGWAK